MDPKRWMHIQNLVEQAAMLGAREREAFLEASCGDDADLREEVESLVKSMSAGAFLETPAPELAGVPRPVEGVTDRAGERVGAFVLRERVGVGGMGSVYRAERVEGGFDQVVAVKVIRPGMQTEVVLRRFSQERRVLAGLTHPNIARLIDGGVTADGAPFLAMEFVEGVPIDAHCRGRPLEERLRLMAEVCDAVQFAHSKLVVHRDLKPGNILVTAEGTAKLLDFGIAKVLRGEAGSESQTMTLPRQSLMTPQYAAPEQVRGEAVGTPTDVYALGLVLFELLTGAKPYEVPSGAPAEAVRIICEQAPAKPSAAVGNDRRLQKALRGDLDTIVLRALAKEPERRYASAGDLGEDLRRYLRGMPVAARPDSTAYRVGKFIARNRVGVAGTAAVAVALVAGLAVSTTLYLREQAARAREHDERMSADLMNAFLVEMFESVSPSEAQGRDVGLLRDLLDAAAKRLDEDLADRPIVAASLRSTLGNTYRLLGVFDEAERLLGRNVQVRTELLGAAHPDTLESRQLMGTLLLDLGRLERAEGELTAVLEAQRRICGDDDPRTLITMNNLGEVVRQRGAPERALPLLEECLERRKKVLGERHRDTMVSMNNVAGALIALKRWEEAEPLARRTYELQRETMGEEHIDTLVSANDLGLIERNLGNDEQAEAMYGLAYAGFRRVLGEGHMDTLITGSNLAGRQRARKRVDEALRTYEELEAAARKSLPADHYLIPWIQTGQGQCLLELERFEEAEQHLLEGRAGLAAAFGEDHAYTTLCTQFLVNTYAAWGRAEQAAEWQARLPVESP